MKNLGKILFISLVLTSFGFATLTTNVSQRSIAKGEAVEVTLEAQGTKVEFPTNEAIEKALGYTIENVGVSTQTFFKFSSNSGSSKEVKKSMSFSFYPNQTLKIPAFEVKIDDKIHKSDPIDITLTDTSNVLDGLFKAEISASKDEAMVGEPIDVTLKFYRRIDQKVMKLQYNKPVFNNFEVKEKGELQPTQEGNYIVQHIEYTIYPKKEGNLTIEPALIHIATPQTSRNNVNDIFGAMFMESKWNKIHSNSLAITAKPIPQDAALVGKFDIVVSVDNQEVEANKPIKLKVEISGEGSLDGLEEIEYKLDGVTCFSDDADIDSNVQNDGTIFSTYKKSFVFLSESDFVIPKQEIKFYNTSTQKIDTLVIPEYRIKVKGGKPKTQSVVTVNPSTKQSAVFKAAPLAKETHGSIDKAWLLLAFLGGGVVSLLLVVLVPKLKNPKTNKRLSRNDEIFKTLYANMDKDPRIEQIVRDLHAQKRGDKSVVIDKKLIQEIIKNLQPKH